MKSFFVAAFLALLSLSAQANDSAFEGVGGSALPMRGENTAIRMVREKVVLTARSNDYTTEANFVFSNETGTSQKVTMGFPEDNYGDVDFKRLSSKSGFSGFQTFVDGRRIAASRVQLHDADEGGFVTYWVKTVMFAPHQTRRVRVQFSSPYGGTIDWGLTRAMSYAFTGRNWRGDVGESVLEVRVNQPGLWRATAFDNNGKPLPFHVQTSSHRATFTRIWKNWQAQDRVVFGLERTIPFWRRDEESKDYLNLSLFNAMRTVRIGAKPTYREAFQGFPPHGFTDNGTFYVGVSHLDDKLVEWGETRKPKIDSYLNFSPSTGFDLRAGTTRIQGKEGDKTVRVNGKLLSLDNPILSISNGKMRLLYVPLAPVARALGWKVAFKGERLFTLEPGNWKG